MTTPYNFARFVQAMEQERHPIMLTAFEMKVISQALGGVHDFVQAHVDQLCDAEEWDEESEGGEDGEEAQEGQEQEGPEHNERLRFLKCHAQHLGFMAGRMAAFAHDIKEKAEAKFDIEI
jgi:hypothetical protein